MTTDRKHAAKRFIGMRVHFERDKRVTSARVISADGPRHDRRLVVRLKDGSTYALRAALTYEFGPCTHSRHTAGAPLPRETSVSAGGW